jgi:hypothetical protein
MVGFLSQKETAQVDSTCAVSFWDALKPNLSFDVQGLVIGIDDLQKGIAKTLDGHSCLTSCGQGGGRWIREVGIEHAAKERHSHVDVHKQDAHVAGLPIIAAVSANDCRRKRNGETRKADGNGLVQLPALAAQCRNTAARVLSGSIQDWQQGASANSERGSPTPPGTKCDRAKAGNGQDFQGHGAAATTAAKDIAAQVIDIGARGQVDGIAPICARITECAKGAS